LHAIAQLARALTREESRDLNLKGALEDLNSLSDAAARLPEVERILAARIDEAETQLARILEVLERLQAALSSLDRLQASADGLTLRADSLRENADRLTQMLSRLPGI
jgi:ferritin-like metal-binding protein YciE